MSVFSEYVTSTAFNITLSRNQISCLCAVGQMRGPWGGTVGSSRALIHKGLITHRSEQNPQYPNRPEIQIQIWELTEAGKAMIPLLKLAGLWIEYPKMVQAYPEDVREPMVRLKEPAEVN